MSSSEMPFERKQMYVVCYNYDKLIDNDTSYNNITVLSEMFYYNKNSNGRT